MSRRIIGMDTLFAFISPCSYNPSRATCHLQTLQPKSAIADFKKILALEPKNETIRAQLTTTQKLIRKVEFEKVGKK
jgi:hypothetical protein